MHIAKNQKIQCGDILKADQKIKNCTLHHAWFMFFSYVIDSLSDHPVFAISNFGTFLELFFIFFWLCPFSSRALFWCRLVDPMKQLMHLPPLFLEREK